MSKRLRAALATEDGKRRLNRRLFGVIAPRYDLITRLLSYGQDQRWKARLIELASIHPDERALDIACGTGDLTLRAADRGARVVGLDLTYEMLALARRRAKRFRLEPPCEPQCEPPCEPPRTNPRAEPSYVLADMVRLPLASDTFDLVTAGYALRNLPDLDAGLRELSRVLKPGGRLVALDFNKPRSRILRAVYLRYLAVVGSMLGWVLHGDPDTYGYIAASLRRYPEAGEVAARMRAARFRQVTWHPVLGGLMAFHVGWREHES